MVKDVVSGSKIEKWNRSDGGQPALLSAADSLLAAENTGQAWHGGILLVQF
jgi:hypothetical protein